MKVLGVYAGHDANLALVEGGRLLRHIEMERVSRSKHFDVRSGERRKLFASRVAAAVEGQSPDVIANAGRLWGFKLADLCPEVWSRFADVRGVATEEGELDGRTVTCVSVPHHVAHIAYTAYIHGVSDAECISVDGGGDFAATVTARLEDGRIEGLRIRPECIGQLWSSQAAYRYGDRWAAGTVMAEAALDPVCAELQHLTEVTLLRIAAELPHKSDKLVLTGGVALNGLASMRLAAEAGYERLVLAPATGDCGLSIGAALYAHAHLTGETPPAHDDAQIMYAGRSYDTAGDGADAEGVARLLAAGRIVGLYQGRAESGPRALGNRSILADPRSRAMHDRLNAEVKHREPFRPYAPACLAEEATHWFDLAIPSPYMMLIAEARERCRREAPAAVHLDGTARVQTVRRDDNPFLYGIIREFGAITGVPMVLNTSFNRRGEPIVETPQDAVACFESTGMDALVLGRRLMEKRKQ